MKKQIGWYLWTLLEGVVILDTLLAGALEHTRTGWKLPITGFTAWVSLSWLLGYPWLRRKYREMYSKNGEHFESYKHRAMTMHHQDMSDSHVNRRWTTNGVSANPWEYTVGETQSTDEILNPILVFAEHLWATFLLILFGPVLVAWSLLVGAVRWVKAHVN